MITSTYWGALRIPLNKSKGKKRGIITTAVGSFKVLTSTPSLDLAVCKSEYTDKQFHADLKKASKRLDAMAGEALRDEAEGKTREFPV